MKYKIVNYNHSGDKYSVIIQCPVGHFTGSTIVKEEDKSHESRFFGYEIAELKAKRKMYKTLKNNNKSLYKVIDPILPDTEYNYPFRQKIQQKINDYEKQELQCTFDICAKTKERDILVQLMDKNVK